MMTMDLQEELKRDAIACGLCEQWQQEWGTPDKEGLLEKFWKGIGFCARNGFPDPGYVRRNFGREFLLRHGVYVDEPLNLANPRRAAFKGCCSGSVVFDGFSVNDVYVCDSSAVDISVRNWARAAISVYGDSSVRISNSGFNTVYVYRYGGTVRTEGNVVVRDRRKKR